jgi:SprT protein
VAAHGSEWKQQFSELLRQFLQAEIFPQDIRDQLLHSLKSPAASSCADDGLMRVLRRYDPVKEGFCLVEELSVGAVFMIKNERKFIRQEKVRKRIKAMEIGTGKVYLFSPIYEVRIVGQS